MPLYAWDGRDPGTTVIAGNRPTPKFFITDAPAQPASNDFPRPKKYTKINYKNILFHLSLISPWTVRIGIILRLVAGHRAPTAQSHLSINLLFPHSVTLKFQRIITIVSNPQHYIYGLLTGISPLV